MADETLCSICSTSIPTGTKKCPKCGTEIEGESEDAVEELVEYLKQTPKELMEEKDDDFSEDWMKDIEDLEKELLGDSAEADVEEEETIEDALDSFETMMESTLRTPDTHAEEPPEPESEPKLESTDGIPEPEEFEKLEIEPEEPSKLEPEAEEPPEPEPEPVEPAEPKLEEPSEDVEIEEDEEAPEAPEEEIVEEKEVEIDEPETKEEKLAALEDLLDLIGGIKGMITQAKKKDLDINTPRDLFMDGKKHAKDENYLHAIHYMQRAREELKALF